MGGADSPGRKPRRRDRFFKPFASLSPSISSPAKAATSSTVRSSSTSPAPVSTAANRRSTASPAAQPSNISPISSAPQPGTSSKLSSHRLLNGALQRLSEPHRATLQPFILPTTDDVDEALGRALAAAKEKQQDCDAKRWTFTFAGRTVTLREEADKVVHWLDRLKDVGDIAASADPIHVGLPWAGVRLLLEVRLSITNCLYHDC